MRKALPILVSLLLCLSAAVQAGVTYKWVDKNGNTVYSQHPPAEGIKFERIQTKSFSHGNSKSASSPAPASGSARDSILRDKAARDENELVRKEMEKNEAEREKNCKLAREKLRFYQVQRRWKDKDGNVHSLDDKERQAKVEEAKQQIADFCS